MGFLRAELTAARRGGRTRRGSIDVDEAAGLFTVVISGLIYLQLANEPGNPTARASSAAFGRQVPSSPLAGRAAPSEVGDEARDERHEEDLAADRLEGRHRPADVGGRGDVAVPQGREGGEREVLPQRDAGLGDLHEQLLVPEVGHGAVHRAEHQAEEEVRGEGAADRLERYLLMDQHATEHGDEGQQEDDNEPQLAQPAGRVVGHGLGDDDDCEEGPRNIAAAQSRTRGPAADAWSASHRATTANDPSRIRGAELPPSANTR